MKSTDERRDPREDMIPVGIFGEPAVPRTIATPKTTQLLSLIALASLVFGLVAVGRGTYFAITDAWVAPMQLSPESREVVALRIQTSKDDDVRARLESELTSVAAEVVAIDLSLRRLRTLESNYSKAVRWNTSDRDGQLATLLEQKALLERQRDLTLEPIERYRAAVERAKKDLEAGVITAADLASAQDNLAHTELTRNEKELEYMRVNASLEEASREADALAGAAVRRASGQSGARLVSPDVVRLDELRINTELQISRLEGDKRSAEARERAARTSIKGMNELQTELESTPLVLAARREIDIAFIPYAHLDGVRVGDAVYRCRWFLFGCRETGRIKRFFPGEVVTDDPWGSMARGHYVELEMTDRSAMGARSLRVRRGALTSGSVVASRSP